MVNGQNFTAPIRSKIPIDSGLPWAVNFYPCIYYVLFYKHRLHFKTKSEMKTLANKFTLAVLARIVNKNLRQFKRFALPILASLLRTGKKNVSNYGNKPYLREYVLIAIL